MSKHRGVEGRLQKLGKRLGAHRPLAQSVIQAIETIDLSASRAAQRKRVWIWRTVGGFAACLVVTASVSLFVSRPTTLFARVVDAFASARTAHGVVTMEPADRPTQKLEFWFDRERGIAVIVGDSDDPEKTEIDDGRFFWSHVTGNDYVARLPSRGPREKFAEMTNFLAAPIQWVPQPKDDLPIEGVACRAFVPNIEESTVGREIAHMVIWADRADRLRRMVGRSERGETKGEIRYDVSVDPQRFDTTFGRKLRVVNGTEALVERFSLHGARYQKEVAGMIFAVHDVRRGETGIAYIVSSVRPTSEARKPPRPDNVGGYVVLSPSGFNRFKDRYQFELAALEAHGHSLSVSWWLQVPKESRTDTDQGADVVKHASFSVQPGTFDRRFKSQVSTRVGEGLLEVVVPFGPLPAMSVEKIAKQVYRDAASLQDTASVRLSLLYEKGKPWKKGAPPSYLARETPPRGASVEDYQQEVKGLVEFYRERGWETQEQDH